MNKLVIAEKASVAHAIAVVIGATDKKDGYLQGNGYIVSWCVGHLVELAQADAYHEKYAKWKREDLPIMPSDGRYQVKKDKEKQLAVLRKLMNDNDVDTIVCATAAGREYETMIRLSDQACSYTKPTDRRRINSIEVHAIRTRRADSSHGAAYHRRYRTALSPCEAD